MTKKELIAQALEDAKGRKEGDFKATVVSYLRDIAELQGRIKKIQADIELYQKNIRELEFEPIEDSVLG